jgi:hypothetical protein
MEPQFRTHETAPLRNWSPAYDEFSESWLLEHYVGGEDGWIAIGHFDTEAQAAAEAIVVNKEGPTHTHYIDL